MSTVGAQNAALVSASYRWLGCQPRALLTIRTSSSCVARRSSNRSQLVMTVMSFSLASGQTEGPAVPEEHRSSEHYSLPSYNVHSIVNDVHGQMGTKRCLEADVVNKRQEVGEAGTRPLWFTPPDGEENRRRTLTRERVVAEALAIISADGVGALSMRALAARLGVVPGALYRHVRSKEQLYDLILDG